MTATLKRRLNPSKMPVKFNPQWSLPRTSAESEQKGCCRNSHTGSKTRKPTTRPTPMDSIDLSSRSRSSRRCSISGMRAQGSPSAAVVSSSLYVFSASPSTDRVPPRPHGWSRDFAGSPSRLRSRRGAGCVPRSCPRSADLAEAAGSCPTAAGCRAAPWGLGLVGLVCGLLEVVSSSLSPWLPRQDASCVAQERASSGSLFAPKSSSAITSRMRISLGPMLMVVSASVRALPAPPMVRPGLATRPAGGWWLVSRTAARSRSHRFLPPRERRGVRSLTPGHPCTYCTAHAPAASAQAATMSTATVHSTS